MSEQNATLHLNGKAIELVVHPSTLGPSVIDVSPLLEKRHFTYDSGFVATAACESKITFIDGAAGILLHRGYPIEKIAKHKSYLENCYLLFYGEFANVAEQTQFDAAVNTYQTLDPSVIKTIQSFDKDAHPMALILAALSQLVAKAHDTVAIDNEIYRQKFATHIIGQMASIVALAYRHIQDLPFIAARSDLNYTQNFLHMLFSDLHPEFVHPTFNQALDRIFTLHADHEQNASTSAVRLVGSTQTDPYAAIMAGVAALWGASHGGANEACLNMLKTIGSVEKIPEFIERAKDKNDPFRLMGFGHRVYKNYDPRAMIMRHTCHEVLAQSNAGQAPLLQIAMNLEKIALEDPYFIQRKLYPNVDFYSGITLSAMGIPTTLFTAIFALARSAGWVSQWHEMLSMPYRIGRPRQYYTGSIQREL